VGALARLRHRPDDPTSTKELPVELGWRSRCPVQRPRNRDRGCGVHVTVAAMDPTQAQMVDGDVLLEVTGLSSSSVGWLPSTMWT